MECPICYYPYDSTQYIPMVGTCGHSVCQQCVSRLDDGKCPLCIKVTMTATSRNYLAIELLAEIDSKTKEQRDQLLAFNQEFSFINKANQQGSSSSNNQFPAQNLLLQENNNGTSVDPFSVYINHIGGWSEEDVFNHFKPFGTIERYGFGGNVNKGFALVKYKHEFSAKNAVIAMHGAPIGPNYQPIVVELKSIKSHNAQAVNDFAQRRLTMQISPKIVVKNLPHVTEEQVRKAFETDGKILHIVLRNVNGIFSGIAFVYFANMMGVQQALKRNGTYFPLTTMKMKIEPFKAAY